MNDDAFSPSLACHTLPTLALPATDVDVLAQVIDPALSLLPDPLGGASARVLLLAIGRQESGFAQRTQIGGPARGLFQFEMGGVVGVMRNTDSASYVHDLCVERDVGFAPKLIYEALAIDDVLAAGMARLLLWTDTAMLPALGQQDLAWNYYLRNWRPGKPGPDRWAVSYQAAMMAVRGEA